MPIDTSIYQQIKPIEMPSALDSMGKAMTLKNLAQQGMIQEKQMAREEQESKLKSHLQRASIFGNAMEGLAGLTEAERAANYPKVHAELTQAGVITPEQGIPAEYDPGFYRQNLFKYRQTKDYLDKQLVQSQITKNIADANRKETADPVARQVAIMDARDQKEQRKKAREIQQYSQVGGWQLKDGATPTLDDAKKFKAGVSAARALLGNLNEYQSLVNTYGTETGGQVAQRMDSLARDIQLTAKNEDLYGLGVLTGPDLKLLEELIQAPTGIGSKLNPMEWGGAKASNKAQQFREMINTRLNAKAKTYGFEPEPEWTKLAAGGSSAAPSAGPQAAYASPPAIRPGTVEDGYVFMGGDPANPKSWMKER